MQTIDNFALLASNSIFSHNVIRGMEGVRKKFEAGAEIPPVGTTISRLLLVSELYLQFIGPIAMGIGLVGD